MHQTGPATILLRRVRSASHDFRMATKALVGEDGGLIAGHARILAARQLGIAEIPVMARPLSAGHGL